MTKNRLQSLIVVVTALLMGVGTAAHGQAAVPVFTQQALLATVTADGTVTARATVSATTATNVGVFGIWVRGTNGNKPGVAYRTSIRINPTGTTISGSYRYAPGTYSYGSYVVIGGKAATVGGARTFTVPRAPSAILFRDDFDGAAGQTFDRSKWQDWSSCSYHASAAYGSIQCGDTETLDGAGHLRVPATPTSGSALSTATKFSFVYGEMSAWIKMPAADGYWPAFWTLNSEPECCAEKTLPLGEIDVVEQYTTWDNLFHRGAHNWAGDQTWGGPDDNSYGNVDLTAGFHEYTARVEPGKISYYFDGQLTGSISKTGGNGKPWAFGPDLLDSNWLILTLAVGGAGGQQNPATAPAEMLVDRVEVRAL